LTPYHCSPRKVASVRSSVCSAFLHCCLLPPRYQHILAERLKAGKAHIHIAIMHEALWRMRGSAMTRMRGSAMTFEERRAELEAAMIATRRCAARWLMPGDRHLGTAMSSPPRPVEMSKVTLRPMPYHGCAPLWWGVQRSVDNGMFHLSRPCRTRLRCTVGTNMPAIGALQESWIEGLVELSAALHMSSCTPTTTQGRARKVWLGF
jgi:hypothetical protein